MWIRRDYRKSYQEPKTWKISIWHESQMGFTGLLHSLNTLQAHRWMDRIIYSFILENALKYSSGCLSPICWHIPASLCNNSASCKSYFSLFTMRYRVLLCYSNPETKDKPRISSAVPERLTSLTFPWHFLSLMCSLDSFNCFSRNTFQCFVLDIM